MAASGYAAASAAAACAISSSTRGNADLWTGLLKSSMTVSYARLAAAVRSCDVTRVRFLLACGAPADARSMTSGATALYVASRRGSASEEIVAALISANADVNLPRTDGATPLHAAADVGSATLVRRLLDRGANARALLASGSSALHVAAAAGHDSVVRVLLEHSGNDPAVVNAARSSDGSTPLALAARRKCVGVVQALLEAGAPASADALEAAVKGGDALIIDALLTAGARAPRALKIASVRGDSRSVRALLESDHAATVTHSDDSTPLHAAATRGDALIVAQLLEAGAVVDAKRHDGATALFCACGALGGTDAVKILVAAGADVNAMTSGGRSALMNASRAGNAECVDFLLHAGADVRAVNAGGRTALFFASESQAQTGDSERVRALLRAALEARLTKWH